MKFRGIALIPVLFRLVWRRRLWFLVPTFLLLFVATILMFMTEVPALIPFFYAIF